MNWTRVSANEKMTLDIMESNIDLPWDYIGISYNPNLTIKFITTSSGLINDSENFNQKWHWWVISRNSNISIKDIENHPEYPWGQIAVLN